MRDPATHLMRYLPRLSHRSLLPAAVAAVAAVAALAALPTPSLGTPIPEANSKLLFASFGDMPYRVPAVNYRQNGQEADDRLVLRRLIEPTLRRRPDIPFLIHLGDIGRVEDACTRPWQEATLLEWTRIGKPLVVIPGGNDWVDCGMVGVQPWNSWVKSGKPSIPASGSQQPTERPSALLCSRVIAASAPAESPGSPVNPSPQRARPKWCDGFRGMWPLRRSTTPPATMAGWITMPVDKGKRQGACGR